MDAQQRIDVVRRSGVDHARRSGIDADFDDDRLQEILRSAQLHDRVDLLPVAVDALAHDVRRGSSLARSRVWAQLFNRLASWVAAPGTGDAGTALAHLVV